jgi:hypothetical protein
LLLAFQWDKIAQKGCKCEYLFDVKQNKKSHNTFCLLPPNHNISFTGLEEIISQQMPFPGHLSLFPGKLLCKEITLLLYFPANERKPTERLSFSTEIYTMEIFLTCAGTLSLLFTCQLPYLLSYGEGRGSVLYIKLFQMLEMLSRLEKQTFS